MDEPSLVGEARSEVQGMTYRTDIPELRQAAEHARNLTVEKLMASLERDRLVRETYARGDVTLAALAKATGLSRQRIHMIVKEGEEMIATCPDCQHMEHGGRCPGFPNCGCSKEGEE